MQETIWTTSDQRNMKIGDMADQHLLNAIRKYYRQAVDDYFDELFTNQGILHRTLKYYLHPKYNELLKEATDRGFKIDYSIT